MYLAFKVPNSLIKSELHHFIGELLKVIEMSFAGSKTVFALLIADTSEKIADLCQILDFAVR